MADRKKSFVMYESWGAAISMMSNEQAGALLKAVYAYQDDPETKVDDPSVAFVFEIIRQKMDEDREKYQKTCDARSAAGQKGNHERWGNSDESQKVANVANATSESQKVANVADTDTDTDTDKEREKKNTKRKAAVPPRIEEVRAYIAEKGYSVNADEWFDYYASNGWHVGRNKMSDWKAAVRTWESKRGGHTREPTPDPQGHEVADFYAQWKH